MREVIFERDLAKARMACEDEHGRQVDLRALRDTFGTHLAASGATPFVLKALMRPSTVQQSEKYYIDATDAIRGGVGSITGIRGS